MKLIKKIYQTKETEKIIDRNFSETKITVKKLSNEIWGNGSAFWKFFLFSNANLAYLASSNKPVGSIIFKKRNKSK